MCTAKTALGCDDASSCTTDGCLPAIGCTHLPVAASTACDDGNACTTGDTCQNGTCTGGTAICQCQQDADCAKFDDGNLCNGVQYCDKAQGPPFLCKPNPATFVVCPSGSDSACQKNTCIAATGQCKLVTAAENSACDDGDKCTQGDNCQLGVCSAGTNTCLCKQTADCGPFEDGNTCNGTLFCNKATGQCTLNPATVVTCQTAEDTYCVHALCNPATGQCAQVPWHELLACDDGNPCTPNESCTKGQCQSATNTCACVSDLQCAQADDGNPCNGTLYCSNVSKTCVVNPATVVTCDPSGDGACHKATCAPASGKCVLLPLSDTPCDDGNTCSPSSLCKVGSCTATTNTCQCQTNGDCAPFEDGDKCNGTLYCDQATKHCVVNPATVVQCPTAFDSACLANTCTPTTGVCSMQPVHQGNPCSSNAYCKKGGYCNLGQCVGETAVCACISGADCLDDGDACNGISYCDTAAIPPVCKVNPKTVVTCSTTYDTACLKNACAPASGLCAITPTAQGPCDDGDPCSVGDTCVAGSCLPGTNTCACKADADCAAKEDGDLCNGSLFCDKSVAPFVCKVNPTTIVACSTVGDDTCHWHQCQAATGKCATILAKEGVKCDADGTNCTASDSCAAGVCKAGVNVCACQTNADCAKSDDADLCNGTLYCDTSGAAPACKINPNSVVTCKPSANPCLISACQPQTGQCATNPQTDGTPCDDSSACTANTVCAQGQCAFGSNWCLCQKDGDCAKFDDANLCNGSLKCDKSGLAPACALVMPEPCETSTNPCVPNLCQAATGLCAAIALPEGAACDDGVACTTGEVCKAQQCIGTALQCNDNNACTVDSCEPFKGCAHIKLLCSDGNPCTLDTCNTASGNCTHSAVLLQSATCVGDGDGCTVGDHCDKGECVVGQTAVCSGGGPCSDAVCQSTGAQSYLCKIAAKANGAPCNALGECQLGATCQAGQCAGAVKSVLWQEQLQWPVPSGQKIETQWQAVLAMPDGGAVIGGTVYVADPQEDVTLTAVVQRRSATGALLWSDQFSLGGANPDAYRIVGLAPLPGGAVAVCAAGLFLGSAFAPRIVAYDGAGGHLWSIAIPGGVLPTAFAPVPGGGLAVAAGGAYVQRLTGDGKPVWSQPLPASVISRAIIASGDGSIFVAGLTSYGNLIRGWAARYSPDGNLLWTRAYGQLSDQHWQVAAVLPSGELAVGGAQVVNDHDHLWLAALDGDGDMRWSHTGAIDQVVQSLRVRHGQLWMAGSALVFDGSAAVVGKQDHFVAAADLLGNVQWQAPLAISGTVGVAIDVTADQRVWAATSKATSGWLARGDAWGHFACTDAGPCLAKNVTDCNDGNACSNDTCSAAAGCGHTGLAGAACATTSGCAGDGQCTAAAACKLSGKPNLGAALLAVPNLVAVEAAAINASNEAVIEVTTKTASGVLGVAGVPFDSLGTPGAVVPWGLVAAEPTQAPEFVHAIGAAYAGWTVVGRSLPTNAYPDQGSLAATVYASMLLGSVWYQPPSPSFARAAALLGGDGGLAMAHSSSNDAIFDTLGFSHCPFDVIPVATPTVAKCQSGGKPCQWTQVFLAAAGTERWLAGNLVAQPARTLVQRIWADSTVGGSSDWVGLTGADITATAIGAYADGALIGALEGNGACKIRRVDSKAAPLWTATLDVKAPCRVGFFHTQPDGTWVAVGTESNGGHQRAWMILADGDAKILAKRSYSVAEADITLATTGGLLRRSDGNFMLVGLALVAGSPKLWVQKTDAWGNATCAESGACFGSDACDDGLPCTADLCDGSKGCAHLAMGGMACDDGDSATANEACVGGVCKAP